MHEQHELFPAIDYEVPLVRREKLVFVEGELPYLPGVSDRPLPTDPLWRASRIPFGLKDGEEHRVLALIMCRPYEKHFATEDATEWYELLVDTQMWVQAFDLADFAPDCTDSTKAD